MPDRTKGKEQLVITMLHGINEHCLSVTRFENELLNAPVQQLAHIEFIVGWTCSFVNPSELLELFVGFPSTLRTLPARLSL
jgi:hypothetical protein